MPGLKRTACNMEPQERMVGRNLSVPREYFGAETRPAKKAKKGKAADAPYIALVLKPVVIENQFYHGAGVEVRLAPRERPLERRGVARGGRLEALEAPVGGGRARLDTGPIGPVYASF